MVAMKGRITIRVAALTEHRSIGSDFEAIDPELALATTEMPPANIATVQRTRPPLPK